MRAQSAHTPQSPQTEFRHSKYISIEHSTLAVMLGLRGRAELSLGIASQRVQIDFRSPVAAKYRLPGGLETHTVIPR